MFDLPKVVIYFKRKLKSVVTKRNLTQAQYTSVQIETVINQRTNN